MDDIAVDALHIPSSRALMRQSVHESLKKNFRDVSSAVNAQNEGSDGFRPTSPLIISAVLYCIRSTGHSSPSLFFL